MVRFFHVARSYPGREVLVDLHLAVATGELTIVTGAAGSGKTTLVRLVLGLDVPRRGWVTVDGMVLGGCKPADLAAHRRRCALIPQTDLLVPELSALDNVALALEVAGERRAAARRLAAATLGRLGLEAVARQAASGLSAVERQWVAIARGLARSEAPLLVADEPGAHLAPTDVTLLGELLAEECARGKTVIVTTGDWRSLAGTAGTRVVRLADGRAVDEPHDSTAVALRAS